MRSLMPRSRARSDSVSVNWVVGASAAQSWRSSTTQGEGSAVCTARLVGEDGRTARSLSVAVVPSVRSRSRDRTGALERIGPIRAVASCGVPRARRVTTAAACAAGMRDTGGRHRSAFPRYATLAPERRQLLMQRFIAAALVVLVVPPIVALASVADEQPIRPDEPAPRTVFAETAVQVTDPDATETARRTAWESVEPVLTPDREAQTAIVREVREVFTSAREVRQPVPSGTGPTAPDPGPATQIAQLAQLEPDLSEGTIRALVALSDGELDVVERETIAIAQELARQRVTADEVEGLLAETIPIELALRNLPGDTGDAVVVPVLELHMQPTVVVDPDATTAARE